jgi:hypothetical protein
MTWIGLLYREQLKGSRAKASVGTGLRLEITYELRAPLTPSTRHILKRISAQIFASAAWSA